MARWRAGLSGRGGGSRDPHRSSKTTCILRRNGAYSNRSRDLSGGQRQEWLPERDKLRLGEAGIGNGISTSGVYRGIYGTSCVQSYFEAILVHASGNYEITKVEIIKILAIFLDRSLKKTLEKPIDHHSPPMIAIMATPPFENSKKKEEERGREPTSTGVMRPITVGEIEE